MVTVNVGLGQVCCITWTCGACAVAVASMLRGVADREVTIELRGGTLRIAWPDDDAHVEMTGPAAFVFSGTFPLPAR